MVRNEQRGDILGSYNIYLIEFIREPGPHGDMTNLMTMNEWKGSVTKADVFTQGLHLAVTAIIILTPVYFLDSLF